MTLDTIEKNIQGIKKQLSGFIDFDDARLNQAKELLAFESTCLAHGREAALKAKASLSAVFGNCIISERILPSSSIPRENDNKNSVEFR